MNSLAVKKILFTLILVFYFSDTSGVIAQPAAKISNEQNSGNNFVSSNNGALPSVKSGEVSGRNLINILPAGIRLDYKLLSDFIVRPFAYQSRNHRKEVEVAINSIKTWIYSSTQANKSLLKKPLAQAQLLFNNIGGSPQLEGNVGSNVDTTLVNRSYSIHLYTTETRQEALQMWQEDKNIVRNTIGSTKSIELQLTSSGLIRVYIGNFRDLTHAALQCAKLRNNGVWCRPLAVGLIPS